MSQPKPPEQDYDTDVRTITMNHTIPPGILGPTEVELDVRAYLVPHTTGLVLVDTGIDPTGQALDAAVLCIGATWADISHVVITHNHHDHTGALDHIRRAAPAVEIFADPLEQLPATRPLHSHERVGSLIAVPTPGHTPGHLSLLDENRGILLAGDCLGVVDGRLTRAPTRFTTDPDQAERTLTLLTAFRRHRLLLGHGHEIDNPWDQLDALLGQDPTHP